MCAPAGFLPTITNMRYNITISAPLAPGADIPATNFYFNGVSLSDLPGLIRTVQTVSHEQRIGSVSCEQALRYVFIEPETFQS